MGSDDIFHKRKAREVAALQRQKHERARNKRFLIVCEGTKTEPLYFGELLADLNVRPQMVRIARNDGCSPDRVVAHALQLYREDAKEGDAYDTVYCVFDRDKHTTFNAAVKQTKDLKEAGTPLEAITSTPCFEFWLLLHFGYTDQPFHAAGKKSVGDQVVAALKTKPGFDQYGKGMKGVYDLLKNKHGDAITHAQRLREYCEATGTINPTTEVDRLVCEIIKIK